MNVSEERLVIEVAAAEGVLGPLPLARIEDAVRRAVRAEGVRHAEISLALLDDAAVAALNRQYLAHEGPTDVISFALHGAGEPPLGDIYLGVEQARRQAAELGVRFEEEVLRLAIHGTLHVLGYDHAEGEARLNGEMFRRQEELLREIAGDV